MWCSVWGDLTTMRSKSTGSIPFAKSIARSNRLTERLMTTTVKFANVSTAVGATAWLFASAGEQTALDVAEVVADAGRTRIAQETSEGAKLAAAAPDPAAATAREATIVQAWRTWVGQAIRSASR